MPCRFQRRRSFTLGILISFAVQAQAFAPFIPIDIRSSVAPCAESCIDNYIHTQFTPFICPSPPTLACLCRQSTSSGQAGPTLGKIVTTCTVLSCLNETTVPDTELDYCKSNQTSTLTTTNMAPTPAETGSSTATSTSTSGGSATHVPPAAPLSPAQIAGVAVGAAAFAFVIFFLIGWFCSHMHRRRNHGPYEKDSRARTASRFGNSDKELAQPYHYVPPFVAEKSTTPPLRPHPTVNTSYSNVDPNLIGVAVSPESMLGDAQRSPHTRRTPHEETYPPADKTPLSAQSTDSTAALLPRLPPQNLKVAIPKVNTRLRAQNDSQPLRVPPPLAQHPANATLTDDTSPRSPDNSVELPCNNPQRQLKLKIPPVAAVRPAPVIPVIKKQAAGRESTQTLISAEPMSPTEPKHTALRPECAPLDASTNLIPSYYYTQLPTPSHIPSASPRETQTPSSTLSPQRAPAKVEPRTPPSQVRDGAKTTPHTASTLVNSVPPPERPRRYTPPPLPAPPALTSKAEEARPAVPPKTPGQYKPRPPRTSSAAARPAPPAGRRNMRDSASSATSLETVFDESTPPDEEPANPHDAPAGPKGLSPVPEAASPRAPRPLQPSKHASTRTVTPQPLQHSDSTLVAKRKGSNAEDSMKRGLWITESNGRTGAGEQRGRFPVRPAHTSPSKTRRKGADGERTPRRQNERDGGWTPSLTPKRTPGGELVIEVS